MSGTLRLFLTGIFLAMLVLALCRQVMYRGAGIVPGRKALLVIGIAGLIATLSYNTMYRVFFWNGIPRSEVLETHCLSNIKQLSQGVLMYAEDHDQTLPPAANWAELTETKIARVPRPALVQYSTQDLFWCPANDKSTPSYAFNVSLNTIKLSSLQQPESIVLLFDANPNVGTKYTGRSLYGGKELADSERHGAAMVAFASGHAKMISERNHAFGSFFHVAAKGR